MQKGINSSDVFGKRMCCPAKPSSALPKKTKKKKNDISKSVNRSCSRRGQSSSRDEEAIKVRDFNESSKKLNDQHSRTFEKLEAFTKHTKPVNMHTYRLSVTRDVCNENKNGKSSQRESDMFSPEHIVSERVLLEKTRNLEEERSSLNQEMEMLKRSEMSLLRVNESLSQQLLNAQKNLEAESERLSTREKKHHEELSHLRENLHEEHSKLLELNSRVSVIQVEKESLEREIKSHQELQIRDRQRITELEITLVGVKQKLAHQEAANTLITRDAECSSTKLAEELSSKYSKELATLEQHHREAVRKLEQTQANEVESMRAQWKHELMTKENDLSSVRMQLSSDNEKLSLKMREFQALATERELTIKNLERKLAESTAEVQQLRSKIELLYKDRVDLTLKIENKDEQLKQAQKTCEQLAIKLHQTQLDKDQFYEVVVESRERIEQLHKEIGCMVEEEDEFMGRFEHIASKIVLLETHMKMDKSIQAQLEERIKHLEQSNKLLIEQSNTDSSAMLREREQGLRLSDQLKIKVVQYRGRWEAAQEKIKRLEKEALQLKSSHQEEVSSLQHKNIYSAHFKKLDKQVDSVNENIHQSAKGTSRSYGRSTGDVLSHYDVNHRKD